MLEVRTEIHVQTRVKYDYYCTSHQSPSNCCRYLLCEVIFISEGKMQKIGHRFFTPRSEMWLLLHRFSWNVWHLNSIMWQSSVLNFTRIRKEISKVRVEVQLRS